MQKTNQEIIDFINAAALYLKKSDKDSKFNYALKKVQKSALKLFEQLQEKIERKRIDHCATDADGIILREADRNYRFTKDALKQLNKEVKALYEEKVEIESYFATEVPKLTEDESEAFMDFVIKRLEEEPGQLVTQNNGKELEETQVS
jgi:competence CoiA-like predicted nuclease